MTTTIVAPGLVGTPLNRVDGVLKVTGQAQYALDAPVEHAAYAVIVGSTIARGKILDIEVEAALAVPGVLRVMTHANAPRITQPAADFMKGVVPAQSLMPLQGAEIVHYGQQIAVVVAETLEAARAGAALVTVAYEAHPPLLTMREAEAERSHPEVFFGSPLQDARGDVDAAFAAARTRVEATYRTPTEHHNPMEPHATVAQWNGNKLTVHEPTQWMVGTRNYLAAALELPPEDVHVISPFVGGGFGSKGFSLPHTLLAALAAREVGRPVKLQLTRAQVMTEAGSRAQTEQHLRIAANADGTLAAIDHTTVVAISVAGDFIEPAGLTTPVLYSCPNVRIRHEAVRLNLGAHSPMRAPGETPGMFALESAMDELAVAAGIDPVELRLRNDTQTDEQSGLPFSGRHLAECLRLGAERFGWKGRAPVPRAMRDGDQLVGWGMASARFGALRAPASARALVEDGGVVVEVATHDLGTGMYTIMTQVAAEALALPLERVTCRIGDSNYPAAPVAGGSMSTASVMPAVQAACAALRTRAVDLAGEPVDYARAAQVAGGALSAQSDAFPGEEQERYSFNSFGAQFVEVRVDEAIGRIRVSRVVGVFDCGRILNPKTSRSQMVGGITMGIGQALLEESVVDPRTGRYLSDSFAEYRIPVNADIGRIEIEFIEEPDYLLNPLGARGVGEIGITGVAAAIANALYHATGKRIRELPITPEKLL